MGSSRLCVKGLPPYLTEQRLRSHFEQQGQLTDVKIARTRDGRSRRLAFIGFRSAKEAEAARKHFDRTFIDTSRISVEAALAPGSAELARPWSRYSEGSSAHTAHVKRRAASATTTAVTTVGKGNGDGGEAAAEDDPKLKDFLQVMQPRQNTKIWGNDSFDLADPSLNANVEGAVKFADDDSDEDDDEYQEFGAGAPPKPAVAKKAPATKAAPRYKAKPEALRHVRAFQNSSSTGAASAINTAEEDAEDSGRLFVRNLPYSVTEEDLTEAFGRFGKVTEVHMPVDRVNHRPKGYAYVMFPFPEHAAVARQHMNDSIFQGRLIHVVAAKVRDVVDEHADGDPKDGTSSYKRQLDSKLKAGMNREETWNSLFMRSDAVADAVATKHKIEKADLLDGEADDAAVRLALGETQVIQETKKVLEEEGVSLDAFEGAKTKKRSKTVIIVKNIPFATTKDDLERLFGKFGTLGRIVLPPARTLALVEFLERAEARAAFKGLAYSRFKNVPLFLEWAPVETFKSAPPKAQVAAEPSRRPAPEHVFQTAPGEDDPLVPALFVRNLDFGTDEATLAKAFAEHGTVRKATILRKRSKATGERRSTGAGFVEYADRESAMRALELMNGVKIEGSAIGVEMSQGTKRAAPVAAGAGAGVEEGADMIALDDDDEGTAKLLVKNMPFEANKKEIQKLFGSFGTLKTVRLPKKFDGTHRGFGFVEFVTKQDAKTAKEALAHTHLYGRHLVLEYAREDESVEELRQKTMRYFDDGPERRLKKAKLRDALEDAAKKRVEEDDGPEIVVGRAKKKQKRRA